MSRERMDKSTDSDLAALETAVRQIAEVGQQEVELKRAELEVRRAELESNERLALASIEANKEYHQSHHSLYNTHLVHRYWFIGALVVVVSIFAILAIYAGAKDLVADLAKLAIGTGIGAFGGYHYGKYNQKND